ncbi:hypothetical protein M0Q97_07195 [Candidatus Dojkabacteria bacterium]|jgi:hypothetical protein|nr:hypothetical protein [Candidatus Dojkabacteria bacterium]
MVIEEKFCTLGEEGKHNIIEDYPNKQFKVCLDGNGNKYRLHIIYPEDKITIYEVFGVNKKWYFGNREERICVLNLNWLPQSLIVGTVGNNYSEDAILSKSTGFVKSSNLGSNSEGFLASHVHVPLKFLKMVNFEFDKEKSKIITLNNLWKDKLDKLGFVNISIDCENDNYNFSYFDTKENKLRPEFNIINNNLSEFKEKLIQKIIKSISEPYTINPNLVL